MLGLTLLGTSLAGAATADKKGPAGLLPGGNSHDPISIDAGKLDYFQKEQKLVYSGNFVAVQGDSTLKGSQLTIFMMKDDTKSGTPAKGGETAAAASTANGAAPETPGTPGAGSSVRHMDVKGPVTVISKDQVGVGDNGSYDKIENKVTLVGNVTFSQGVNVVKGDRLVYDLTTGQAQIFSGQTYDRVRSVFTPGASAPGDKAAGDKSAAAGKPVAGSKPKPTPKAKPAGTASTQ